MFASFSWASVAGSPGVAVSNRRSRAGSLFRLPFATTNRRLFGLNAAIPNPVASSLDVPAAVSWSTATSAGRDRPLAS
ncbi:MAG TPA: hypothetical protein VM533_13170 [Fimbriiglobus sp.]|nr:hypothetical protein [Fimbriiglobus sp.]